MVDGKPRIGDEVYIHGYIDEIRNDVVIIRNEGGYFGTSDREIFYYEEDERGYGTMNEADRKTEPQYSEDDMYWLSLVEDVANGKMSDAGANQAWLEYINHKTEPTISKMEQVDEPKTQTETQNSNLTFKTLEYCDICDHKGCEECIANALDEHCVPSHFEEAVKDKPQLKEDGELEILTQTIEFPDTHQRFMFTRSIRADGDCLIIGDWEYKGKEDEPQTERSE